MIKKLTEREHILTRPTMYIGAVDLTTSNEYILSDDKIEYKEVKYVPGLIKIINEIIDNSVDVAIKTNFKSSNEISVKITSEEVQVQDNGTGIPIKQNEDGHYLPELCWNHARAGSNFDDDKNRTQIGMNGVGSYATACFSKKFIGNTDDGINNYTITIKDNASSFTEKLDKTKSQGTTVKFYPDLEKFDLKEIDDTHISIIKQRLINLSMTFPEITFKFNSKKININSFKKYIALFDNVSEIYETEDYRFAILPNESDDFKQFSYVNGLKIPDGGTHIDVIINNIVNPIREKLIKKYKTIKPADIKNKLMIVAFLKNLSNTKFNSQTKEKITNSTAELVQYYGNIDFTKITNKILKTPEIIDPITEVYKIKEELKKRQELKNADKQTNKKPKSEKFMPPIGEWTNIFLAEGDSAANSISKIIGRQGNGFYAMFGVPPNAYDMDLKEIISSKKMIDLQQILGLQFSKTSQDNINFKNIIITTDFDLPGHFIAGQLFGLFYRFGKNLFEEHRIKRLITPLIVVKDSKEKIIKWFYSFDDYREFEEKNFDKKYKYDYKKGIGSWNQIELEYIIEKDGLDNMLEVMTIEDSAGLIDDWLSDKKADRRKEMLDGYEFNIMNL
jgi:DNA gyrase/topoisomerase IV subunit B